MATWLPWLGFAATLLLVVVGLLNYSIFRRQLHLAKLQMDLAMRHLELSQKQPDLMLIQRAVSETSNHTRVLVERAWLRPYFYDDVAWREGDRATRDEVQAMAELMLNNFASALMHSAAFPEYPVRGIDRIISFHLGHSPALRAVLEDTFDRFPFTGVSMLWLMTGSREGAITELERLTASAGIDEGERARREALLGMVRTTQTDDPLQFTVLNMQKRR